MAEKILALVTESEATKNDLCGQLSTLLDGYMKVTGYATESGVDDLIRADLIVFSSNQMFDIAKDMVDPACQVIIANRSLNLNNIDQLFLIPKGSRVLVVNDLIENAHEVINLLNEIGLDHLNYSAYSPGEPFEAGFQYAVTPGEVSLIPKSIANIVDLGSRNIDITTIIEILGRLNLLDEKAHFISAKYIETIVRLNKHLHDSINEAGLTNQHLVKVLNHVNDGMLAYNDNGIITVFNETSESIFGRRATTAIGKNLMHVIRDKTISNFLLTHTEDEEMVGYIGDSEYIISRFKIEKLHAFVCTLTDTKNALTIEKKLRQIMMKKGFIAKYRFSDVIGGSSLMQITIDTAKKLAMTDMSILIHGESGVGKEIFSSAIHNSSPRCNGPFLAINFSALPEELAESELFGYEDGAFTGAKKGGRKGLFEEANGGTIFLDEIGDISPRIQTRLLRVLQEKEIRRVGGTDIIPVNVRVIAATNRDLVKMCQQGIFREDLYHRLRKLYLKIPPLRAHKEDLNVLIDHFASSHSGPKLTFIDEVMAVLNQSPWNGNIRELQNLIDFFQAVTTTGHIELTDLPDDYYDALQSSQSSLLNNIDQTLNYHSLSTSLSTDTLSNSSVLTQDDLVILRCIHTANALGKGIGRQGIATAISADMPYLTSTRIRKRADMLCTLGFITKGAGRSGMRLTKQGLILLNAQGIKSQ